MAVRGPAGAAAAGGQRTAYKWVALSNTTLGVLMATLNGSVVLISLPAIFRGIGLDPLDPANASYLLWMIMGYLVVTAVLVVTFGRVGDMFGRVRMYNLGFVVFTAGSVLLTATWSAGSAGAVEMIAFRILQGVGGAMLMANSAAILTDAFPAGERGLALGINGVAGIAGQFVGLLVGGLLSAVNWRLVFLVSVPVGLAGTFWAYRSLRETSTPSPARMDWYGNLTFAVGLVLVLVGITYGIQPAGGQTMGWATAPVLAELIGGACVLALFALIERRVAQPLFRLDLFRIRAFSAGNLAGLCAAIGRGGLTLMLVIWLQGIWLPLHGYSFTATPLWAAIYTLPLTVGFLVAGPVSGLLSDRFGARPFATGGMLAAAATFLLLMQLPADFAYTPFAVLLFCNGMAMGLFSSPNTAGVMNSVPPDQRGAASGMRATFQNAGQTLSIGLFFTLMIVGLTNSLPARLDQGLAALGVPAATAASVAKLPPVGILFAAFLGYNPMQSLLGATLKQLPAATAAQLTGQSFFPHLIAVPFADGMRLAFTFATVMVLIAAAVSWLRGGRYVYQETRAREVGPALRSLDERLRTLPADHPVARSARGGVVAGELVGELRPLVEGGERPAAGEPLVVTISAAYGAGGSYIGPQVARQLGLPFIDRAIPTTVAHRMAVSYDAAFAHDQRAPVGIGRLIAATAPLLSMTGMAMPATAGGDADESAFRLYTEEVLHHVAETSGGVILGRGAAIVLAERPCTLRVRLTGPLHARLRQATVVQGVDAATARERQQETDPAREAYVRSFYHVDIDDPALYHLVLDSTAIPLDACVAFIVQAARARLQAVRPEGVPLG